MVASTDRFLLDTHALIWFDSSDSRLGPQSDAIIYESFLRGDLFISAASFWEVGVKINKGKFALAKNKKVPQWRRDLLRRDPRDSRGYREIPMDGEIAVHSVALRKFNRDPFDCVIAATAILRRARLITADEKLLKIKTRGLSLLDARK